MTTRDAPGTALVRHADPHHRSSSHRIPARPVDPVHPLASGDPTPDAERGRGATACTLRSIERQVSDGRWHAQVTVGTRLDSSADRKHVSRATRAELDTAVRALERSRDPGRDTGTEADPTLGQWLEPWLENVIPNLDPVEDPLDLPQPGAPARHPRSGSGAPQRPARGDRGAAPPPDTRRRPFTGWPFDGSGSHTRCPRSAYGPVN